MIQYSNIDSVKNELLIDDKSINFYKRKYDKTYQKTFDEVLLENESCVLHGFLHKHLYSITTSEIESITRGENKTEFPYGDIKGKEPGVDRTSNFSPDKPFNYIFHHFIENQKKIPSWCEFFDYIKFDYPEFCYNKFRKNFKRVYDSSILPEINQLERGLQYRLANSYSSCLRELDFLIRMRNSGVDMKYHLLADIVLKVDFWVDNNLISIFISNPEYKKDDLQGRKKRTEEVFSEENFNFINIEIPYPSSFDKNNKLISLISHSKMQETLRILEKSKDNNFII